MTSNKLLVTLCHVTASLHCDHSHAMCECAGPEVVLRCGSKPCTIPTVILLAFEQGKYCGKMLLCICERHFECEMSVRKKRVQPRQEFIFRQLGIPDGVYVVPGCRCPDLRSTAALIQRSIMYIQNQGFFSCGSRELVACRVLAEAMMT